MQGEGFAVKPAEHMRVRSILSIVLAALLMTPVALVAQARSSRPLTLAEVVDMAVERNLTLRQARVATSLEEVALSQERAERLPDLMAAVGPGTNWRSHDSRWHDTVAASLTSSVTLFNGGATSAAVRRASRSLGAARGEAEWTRQSVAYDAAAGFLLAAMRERQIEVTAALLRVQEAELERTRASFESGLVPQSTVLQQRALVASTRAQLVQARQAWLEQLLALKALLLLPASEDLRLATPGDAELDALVAVARPAPPPAQRPDVAAQRLRVEAAEAAVDEADAADRPTLSLSGTLRSGYSSDGEGDMWRQGWEDSPEAGVSLALRVPIFDRHSASLAEQRARLQESRERLVLSQTEHNAAVGAARAGLDVESAEANLAAASEALAAAEEAYQAVQARYSVGAATAVDLIQVESQRLDAAISVVEQRYQLLLGLFSTAYEAGRLDALLASLRSQSR